ncbi:transmembrane alpha-helix domain-containing protein [Purpureocillium lavendulum]|uniref:Transmembrane alpha-helix domain-containing protein n=1 Tax=Purpureocillium lavendulum TaxID=1247861 RepID=A0AB34G6Y3_9HYPO|nr:transmembrane alpha-helix domain-containing protein [Purpureocillium lavendulum]
MTASLSRTRLPPPSAVLALTVAVALQLTSAHVLPRETKSVHFRPLKVEPWPLAAVAHGAAHPTAVPAPAPTAAPVELRDDHTLFNTVCGYIGGNPALPATCMAGSHCAVDVEHGAIGCCPNSGDCNSGIFTGCVDRNSGPQTADNPYVYTCAGKNVCYKNVFDGGYFQYGCGSASNLATSVAMSASGRSALRLSHMTVSLTATATARTTPTTIGSSSTSSDTKSDTEPGSTQASPSTSATSDAAAPAKEKSSPNTGAIVGGAVGGVAFLAALVALGFLLWRRRRGNTRRGPGPDQGTKYISPMAAAHRDFEALPSSHEASERDLPLQVPHRNVDGVSPESADGDVGTAYPHDYLRDGVPPEGVMSSRGHDYGLEQDRVPLTREIDDFSHGFNSALENIQEDDSPTQPNTDYMASYPGPRRTRGGGGILWQQNRRQARNPMWM